MIVFWPAYYTEIMAFFMIIFWFSMCKISGEKARLFEASPGLPFVDI